VPGPDGDLFEAISTASRRSSPTDRDASPSGDRARVREELEADVIVTATGLNLLFLGGMELASTARRSTCRRRWLTRG
jgi:cation diffusion facilitator CzcD-associated flavoprotein CzcO